MKFNTIIVAREGKEGVGKLTLNRPDALNAINVQLLTEMGAAVQEIEKDTWVKVLVITGAGRAFCAGADLKGVKGLLDDQEKAEEFLRLWHKVFNAIENLPKPVIAAVNGIALAGGLELIQVCDIAIASEGARLGDQHANFGLVAGGGGTQRLPRLVGVRKAKELLLSGNWLSPAEAERIGLWTRVVPADQLDNAVAEMAKRLASKSPVASKTIKALVNQGMQTDLYNGLELEIRSVVAHFATQDCAEGIKAFEEKRTPVFTGN